MRTSGMRIPLQSLRSTIAFIAVVSARGGAQAKAPQLRAVQDLRVDQVTPTPNRAAGDLCRRIVAGPSSERAVAGFDSGI